MPLLIVIQLHIFQRLLYKNKKKDTTVLAMVLYINVPTAQKTSLRKSSVKKDKCLKCANNFIRLYEQEFPDECPQTISKYMWGKHKWHVLRMMTKAELLQDYQRDAAFGHKLKAAMSRQELLQVLKRHSGLVREWILLKE